MIVSRAMSIVVLAVSICAVRAPALADDPRPEHYQGQRAETLAQALQHLTDYNLQLASVLDRPSLTLADLDVVHQLTYTIENALERISIELGDLADWLESVHVASEQGQYDLVLRDGRAFIDAARPLTQ